MSVRFHIGWTSDASCPAQTGKKMPRLNGYRNSNRSDRSAQTGAQTMRLRGGSSKRLPQPSMAIYRFSSAAGLSSFLGIRSFNVPSSNLALISSCLTASPI